MSIKQSSQADRGGLWYSPSDIALVAPREGFGLLPASLSVGRTLTGVSFFFPEATFPCRGIARHASSCDDFGLPTRGRGLSLKMPGEFMDGRRLGCSGNSSGIFAMEAYLRGESCDAVVQVHLDHPTSVYESFAASREGIV